jgi:hypothetical protein
VIHRIAGWHITKVNIGDNATARGPDGFFFATGKEEAAGGGIERVTTERALLARSEKAEGVIIA